MTKEFWKSCSYVINSYFKMNIFVNSVGWTIWFHSWFSS